MAQKWTLAEIPDLSGKTAIVTGANSGLGFETSKALAAAGAQVVLACRNQDKAQAAKDAINAECPNANLALIPLNLAALDSVRAFAETVNERFPELHFLINNAGVMALPERKTEDGFEMQFGTNHLGHFALTGLLFERLKTTPGARIVTVSSHAHRFGKIRFNDPQWNNGYSKWPAYGQSKLANLMFAIELGRRASAQKLDVLSLAAHPGFSATNLQYAGPRMTNSKVTEFGMKLSNQLFSQSQADGALPTLFAAVSNGVANGDYLGPGGFQELWGAPEHAYVNDLARNSENGKRLWALSEELTGVAFA